MFQILLTFSNPISQKMRKVEKKEPHKISNKFKNNTQIIPEQNQIFKLGIVSKKIILHTLPYLAHFNQMVKYTSAEFFNPWKCFKKSDRGTIKSADIFLHICSCFFKKSNIRPWHRQTRFELKNILEYLVIFWPYCYNFQMQVL